MTTLNRPGNQPGRSPRVPHGFTRAGGVIPIALCEACQVGDHYDCDTNACECAHHCACGQHPTMCRCDAIYDERHGN